MNNNNAKAWYWPFSISLSIALLLELWPMPQWMAVARPEWVALVLVFWVLYLPYKVGVLGSWLVGVLVDLFKGDYLGLNALKYAVIAYLCLTLYQRVRMFNLLQQSMMVFLLLGLTKLMSYWWQERVGSISDVMWFLLPSLVSALLWPFIYLLIRRGARRWHV
jgi:rod shape-determining protein MreD